MKNGELSCLRCGHPMRFIRREKLQLGQTGWVLGDLPNLLAGALEMDIYGCEDCGKLEFYAAREEENGDSYVSGRIATRACPACGHTHDVDFPRCPYCRHSYV